MEQYSSARDISEKNSKFVSSLDENLASVEKKYLSEITEISKMKGSEQAKYAAFKENAVKEARKAIENDDFSVLPSLERKLAEENSKYTKAVSKYEEAKAKINQEYNSSAENFFITYFSQASSMIEKRIKDAYDLKSTPQINIKEVEDARNALRELGSKHIRKEIEKKTFMGKTYEEAKNKAESIIRAFDRKNLEKSAVERYSMSIPFILKLTPEGEYSRVSAMMPLSKSFEKKNEIDGALFEEIFKVTEDLNDSSETYVGYNFKINKEKLQGFKNALESKLSAVFGKLNLKAKIYELHVKPMAFKPAEISVAGKEKVYTLDEVSGMKGISRQVLLAMAGGYGIYKNHPIQQFCVRTKSRKGRRGYSIRESGLKLFDAPENAISLDDTAKQLGFKNTAGCYGYIAKGEIKTFKKGKRVYVTNSSLTEFLSSHVKSEKSGRWKSKYAAGRRLKKIMQK